nr:fit family protein scs3 [Quercus suber]
MKAMARVCDFFWLLFLQSQISTCPLLLWQFAALTGAAPHSSRNGLRHRHNNNRSSTKSPHLPRYITCSASISACFFGSNPLPSHAVNPLDATMTTRRTTTSKVEISMQPKSSNGTSRSTPQNPTTSMNNLDQSPYNSSPFLPTLVEASLLAIYPITLLAGSLFSSVHGPSRSATYSAISQSYVADEAPSYFAKKSNVFNVYFVKVGWFWTTLAFFLLILTHPSLGPRLKPQLTRRRAQAIARYLCVTTVWILVTQWCFGPGIVDRSFRWTGGQCAAVMNDTQEAEEQREAMGDVREALTHAACKAIGGQWKGGHDISGHVFLLILGSAMLWLEVLPAALKMEGLREARQILTSGGHVRSASVESVDHQSQPVTRALDENSGLGVKVALGVAGLSWWMLLMTAAFFHTWFEKFTGLLVAFTAIYLVYFLPRAIPAMRRILGMPGV